MPSGELRLEPSHKTRKRFTREYSAHLRREIPHKLSVESELWAEEKCTLQSHNHMLTFMWIRSLHLHYLSGPRFPKSMKRWEVILVNDTTGVMPVGWHCLEKCSQNYFCRTSAQCKSLRILMTNVVNSQLWCSNFTTHLWLASADTTDSRRRPLRIFI